ncbi:hypothetical protein [Endozoicomonas elysicola]|nr:hypothetical protein [Endozoicomonas elysicola]
MLATITSHCSALGKTQPEPILSKQKNLQVSEASSALWQGFRTKCSEVLSPNCLYRQVIIAGEASINHLNRLQSAERDLISRGVRIADQGTRKLIAATTSGITAFVPISIGLLTQIGKTAAYDPGPEACLRKDQLACMIKAPYQYTVNSAGCVDRASINDGDNDCLGLSFFDSVINYDEYPYYGDEAPHFKELCRHNRGRFSQEVCTDEKGTILFRLSPPSSEMPRPLDIDGQGTVSHDGLSPSEIAAVVVTSFVALAVVSGVAIAVVCIKKRNTTRNAENLSGPHERKHLRTVSSIEEAPQDNMNDTVSKLSRTPKHRVNHSTRQALNTKYDQQVEASLSRYGSRISLASQLSTTSRYISQKLLNSSDEPVSLVAMTEDQANSLMQHLSLKAEQEDYPLSQITEEDETST